MELTLRTRANVSRSTKGQHQIDCTIEITATGEWESDSLVENTLTEQRNLAMDKLNLAITELESEYPFDASKS